MVALSELRDGRRCRRRFQSSSCVWPERMGYLRLQGALANLGHAVARTTIANILKCHGFEPAPELDQSTGRQPEIGSEAIGPRRYFNDRGHVHPHVFRVREERLCGS